MSSSRPRHLAFCLLVSAIATAGAVALDAQRAGVHQTRLGLSWARQVATQAESMILEAKENREADPLDWAVNNLAQGVEPRLVHVHRMLAEGATVQNPEKYVFRADTGDFEYTKLVMPENGGGIRVSIKLGYLGFLGSKTHASGDLLAALLFALCFAVSFFASGRYFGFDDTGRIRARIRLWIDGAKTQLTRHGAHIREMVRQSQRLAVSAGHSRDLVGELRAKIHEGLTELHGSRQFYKEGDDIAARAETLALNVAIAANRLGGSARAISEMATELHRQVQSLRAINGKGRALVQDLEKKIEPWSTDADLAHQSFDDVKDATDLLGRHIRSTTESLMGQAKLIQGLHRDLEDTKDAPEPLPVVHQPQPQLPSELQPPSRAESDRPEPMRLPDPLPPIEERRPKPLFRRLKARKAA